MLDNPTILFAVIFVSFLGAVIVLGIIGAIVARLVTNFFGKNVPSDAAMKAFETAQAAAKGEFAEISETLNTHDRFVNT